MSAISISSKIDLIDEERERSRFSQYLEHAFVYSTIAIEFKTSTCDMLCARVMIGLTIDPDLCAAGTFKHV